MKIFYSSALFLFIFTLALPASAHVSLRPHTHEENEERQGTINQTREATDYSVLQGLFPTSFSSDTPNGIERTTCLDPTKTPHNYFEVALIAEDDNEIRKIGSPNVRLSVTVLDTSRLGNSNDRILDAFRRAGNVSLKLVAIGNNLETEGAPLACIPINTLSISVERVWYLPPAVPESASGLAERFDTSRAIDGFNFTASRVQWGKEGISDVFGTRYSSIGSLFRGRRSEEEDFNVIPTLSEQLKTGVYRLDYKFEAVGYGTDRKRDEEIRYLFLYLTVNPENRPNDEEKFRNDVDAVIRRSEPAVPTQTPAGQTPSSISDFGISASFGGENLPVVYRTSEIFGSDNPCPGDVNGDGMVNIIDLVLVAQKFGSYSAGLAEDVNGDGRVNIIDLVTVARRFGQSCDLAAYNPDEPQRVVFVPVSVIKQSQNLGFASVLKSIFWVIGE